MVEHERDPERLEGKTEETGAEEADPTLDVVRQLIVAAEALPAPARRPSGPATPRPEAPAVTPAAAAPAPQPAPDPAPTPDAGLEAWDDDWDDDPDDESWDDLTPGGAVRPYGIVDLETGEVVAQEGADALDGGIAAPAGSRRPRKRVVGRWLGRAIRGLAVFVGSVIRAVAGLVGSLMRALAAWAAARLAAAGRVTARFLRRPDAPRRLAVALLVIFVIAWPWKVLWLTLLIPLAALVTWASVGNDGCVELIVRWHARIKAHDANKAERIRLRAKAVSAALERGLERLPERWTHGIYLPDFEPEGFVPDRLQVDPFEELAARVHSAKRAGGG